MNQEVVFQPFQLDGYECVAYHPKEIGSELLPTVYLQKTYKKRFLCQTHYPTYMTS